MVDRFVIVVISPDRMDVLNVQRGQVIGQNVLTIELPNDVAQWTRVIRELGEQLKSTLSGFTSSMPRDCIVLHRSPSAVTDIVSLPVSPNDAIEAAELECLDGLPYSAMTAICDSALLGRDGAADYGRSHVVVAAERDDVCDALAAMVQSAGLRLRSIIPFDAAMSISLAQRVLRESEEQQGLLYIGEHSSFFMAGQQRSLLFRRRLNFGVHSLRSALMRAMHHRDQQNEITISEVDAVQILERFGIPERDVLVHAELNLSGADFLPLLLPNLQRFIVELRQSLRFGLSEHGIDRMPITLAGPGARIPGLGAVIAAELDIDVTSDSTASSTMASAAGAIGCDAKNLLPIRAALRGLNLLPRALNRQRRTERLARCMWAGAVAAMVFIAADAMRVQDRLETTQMYANAVVAQHTDRAALQPTSERLLHVVKAVGEVDSAITRALAGRAPASAILMELSTLSGAQIRLTSLGLGNENDEMGGSISGIVYADESAPSADAMLADYVHRLRHSPLISHADLGRVYIGRHGDRNGLQFEIEVIVERVPHSSPLELKDAPPIRKMAEGELR